MKIVAAVIAVLLAGSALLADAAGSAAAELRSHAPQDAPAHSAPRN
jgi:hypothetical protein